MRLVLFYHICKACGTRFTSPSVSGYGEFLMRSAQGDIVYLNAIKDPLFDEFYNVIDEYTGSLKQHKKDEILRHNFGFACDRAADGTFYQITNKPKCSNCHAEEYTAFGITNPPESVDIDIKPATHNLWNSLDSKTQNKIIADIIEGNIQEANNILTLH
jgi:hypothetical protein